MTAYKLRYTRTLQLYNMKSSVSPYQGNIMLVKRNQITPGNTDITTTEDPVTLSNESLNFCLINGRMTN